MSCSITIHPDNSILFSVTLTNQGTPVNDATVTTTLYDSSDVEVTGQVWPLTLVYEAASDGIYSITANPISGLEASKYYKVVISALGADNLQGTWTHRTQATLREC